MEHNRGRAWLYDEVVLRAVMWAQPIYITDRVYIGKDGNTRGYVGTAHDDSGVTARLPRYPTRPAAAPLGRYQV